MAYVQGTSATGFASTLACPAITVTGGNALTVWLLTTINTTLASGISGGGNSFLLAGISAAGNGFYSHAYYVLSAASGSTTVGANGGAANIYALYGREDSGFASYAGSSTCAISPGNTTPNAIITGNVTFSTAGVLMGVAASSIAIGSTVTTNTPVAGTNYTYTSRTLLWGANPYWGQSEDTAIASSGSYAAAWTAPAAYATDTFIAVAVGYNNTGASAAPGLFYHRKNVLYFI